MTDDCRDDAASSAAIFVLGAPDAEMAEIETILRQHREHVVHAMVDGHRVHPGNAYSEGAAAAAYGNDGGATIYFVEVAGACYGASDCGIVIDHHRPGDPGYGRPAEEFFPASSLGQVLMALRGHDAAEEVDGVWYTWRAPPRGYRLDDECSEYRHDDGREVVPMEVVLTAAADHCLEAAYRGLCPGVDPDALLAWRVQQRARHQGRTAEAVMGDIAAARDILRSAIAHPDRPTDDCDCGYVDLRGRVIAELPEAACLEGIAYLAEMTDPTGRRKVVLGAAPRHLVSRLLAGELVPGLVDYYGDPARGFGGGYMT